MLNDTTAHSQVLNEEIATHVEKFITNNHPIRPPAISSCYVDNLCESFHAIDSDTSPTYTYIRFGESAQGLTEYGLYKSNSGIVYGLITYCGSLTNYFLIKDNPDEEDDYDYLICDDKK